MSEPRDRDSRQGRRAALVIVLATLLWLALQWVGPKMGWSAQAALIGDFAALAAYIYALALVWRIWRRGSGK